MSKERDHQLRAGAEYRRERLEAEHERLERRLRWAMHRKDDRQITRISRHLDALESEIDADLAPGRSRGHIETGRRIK